MSYDYATQTAWLDDLGPGFNRFAQIPLCEMHADRITAPLGWAIIDDRKVAPPLFLTVDVA